MNRQEAIVEFFRTRLTDEEQRVERIKRDGGCCAGCSCGCSGLAAMEAAIEADHALLERYDYCVRMGGCPGNEDLDAARDEYEMYTFPLRIARFSDHPVYAALALDSRWVEANYVAARDAEA